MPDGLTLDKSSGAISGTPTKAASASVTITAPPQGTTTKNQQTFTLTIHKGAADLGTLKVTNGGTKTTTFTYGDTITVSGTIKASGTAPQANTLAAPGKNQAALLLGGTQLTDPVAVAGNGSFTLSYKTSEKGIQTTGQAQILTVKYGGSDDLNEGSAACSITLNPKKVQAEVDGAITKPFDQTAKAHVTLKLAEGALVNSSDDVTVSAPDAAYEKTDVGNDIAINLGTLQVDGNEKSFYQVIAPRRREGGDHPKRQHIHRRHGGQRRERYDKDRIHLRRYDCCEGGRAIPQGGERAVCGTKNDCPSLWGSCAGH